MKDSSDTSLASLTDYRRLKLSDVAQKVNVNVDRETTSLNRFVAGEHMRTDNLRITDWGTIGDNYLGPAFNKMFKAGQILYGSRRTYLRKVAVPHFDGICANTTFVLESKGDDLLPQLLPFVMQSSAFNEHAIRESRGSTNPYVNWKDIAKYEFDAPARPEDQRRIAQLILATEDSIQKQERLLEETADFRKVLLRELLSEGLWHKKFKQTQIGKIPESWQLTKLTNVSDIHYGLGQTPEFDSLGIPMVRATDIKKGRIVSGTVKCVRQESIPKKRDPYLKKGDLLVVRSGAYTGDAAMYDGRWNIAIAGYDLVVSPMMSKINPEFLAFYILGETAQGYFRSQRDRSAQPHINSKQVGETIIPLPSLQEQQRIAALLTGTDNVIDKGQQTIKATKALKKELIDDFLSKKVPA